MFGRKKKIKVELKEISCPYCSSNISADIPDKTSLRGTCFMTCPNCEHQLVSKDDGKSFSETDHRGSLQDEW